MFRSREKYAINLSALNYFSPEMDNIGMRAFDLTVVEPTIHLVEVKNVVVQPEDCKQLFDAMMELSNGKKVWVLGEANAVKMVTRTARLYIYERGSEVLHGAAMVVNTDIARMVISFFMQIGEVPFSMKVFENRNKAIQWIKEHTGEI